MNDRGRPWCPAQLDQDKLQIIDTWKHKADVGRKYGALNGDCKFRLPRLWHRLGICQFAQLPMHCFSCPARRPQSESMVRVCEREECGGGRYGYVKGIPVQYPIQMDVDCKRPTLLPATLHCALDKRSSDVSGDTVRFAVLTEDKAKEPPVTEVHPVRGLDHAAILPAY
eukprot:937159-Pelagomonas_calceolata.AAC.1